ncbi:hypothetical protein ABIE26_000136 [Pedobacter africanus]|uniref:Uncharacterized protein n=1 Tax=Pedobacter africanus TaxID=151894 RepID=A0ACC6KWC4_9SPHI|nr:hypothetical protein [Pedobacter africanus]MDR6783376.1 hypothetical protein [Pedobacter africanus]
MKTIQIFAFVLTMITLSACAQLQQAGLGSNATANAVDNTSTLPTGVYFIVNAEGKALTPLNPSIAENVFLRPFTKSGVQKWLVTQRKTTKGITYNISLDGADNLYLQPYAVKDHTPVIGGRNNAGISYKITAAQSSKCWYIKSTFYNGDALRSFVFSPNTPTEIRFEAAENTGKFLWKFIPADN